MAHPPCPQMDVLGNKLIESYRTMIDVDVPSALNHHGRNNPIAAVQQEMIQHRNSCMLCKRNMASRTMKVIPTRAA